MRDYVNHAHNEYLQWWLEAGVPALVAMALAAVALALTARGLALRRAAQRADGVAALIALLAILAHSTVDYPLRTPALLAVAAALAGMAAAEAAGGSGRSQRRAIPA
ncbi:MAG: O-antigen ligase family protein [Dokdonella sp.]|nr:O-antigen ligase family protein [Dokdonella sp.]